MAYAYFASGFVGEIMARRRHEPLPVETAKHHAKDAS
jgi:hypothetical protein